MIPEYSGTFLFYNGELSGELFIMVQSGDSMKEKTGRKRILSFEETPGLDKGTSWMIGMLVELGDRTYDQVEHLDDQALNFKPEGSYLITSVLLLHLVQAELNLFGFMCGDYEMPDYAALVAHTNSADLSSKEGVGRKSVEILGEHLKFRKEFLMKHCSEAGFFDGPSLNPKFKTRRDVMGHLIWHWANHSGHIGAITLSAGHEYIWQ